VDTTAPEAASATPAPGAPDRLETASAGEDAELRVSSVELFFDLVFVFTLTQLTSALEHDLSLSGAAQVVLIFVVLFWMYGGYAWLTNQVPPVRIAQRLLLIAGMAAFLVCALAIPHLFDGTGVAFGLGYLLVVLVHAGLYVEAYGRAAMRFVPLNVVGALCLVAAGLVGRPTAWVLWLMPIPLQLLTSTLTRAVDQQTRAGFDVRPAHFVERHGLVLLIAFGESIVSIGIGLGAAPLSVASVGAMLLGLVLVAALWWTYFDGDSERAEAALTSASLNDRVKMALNAYFYAYIPMLLGIVTLAAGVTLTVGDVGARLGWGPALLLAGGTALYLLGQVAFRAGLRIQPAPYHTVAAVASLGSLAAGVYFNAGIELVALAVVLIVMHIAEARHSE
jgi:low temperature requirement protein LtrA